MGAAGCDAHTYILLHLEGSFRMVVPIFLCFVTYMSTHMCTWHLRLAFMHGPSEAAAPRKPTSTLSVYAPDQLTQLLRKNTLYHSAAVLARPTSAAATLTCGVTCVSLHFCYDCDHASLMACPTSTQERQSVSHLFGSSVPNQ